MLIIIKGCEKYIFLLKNYNEAFINVKIKNRIRIRYFKIG